jgi:hypothetical protein
MSDEYTPDILFNLFYATRGAVSPSTYFNDLSAVHTLMDEATLKELNAGLASNDNNVVNVIYNSSLSEAVLSIWVSYANGPDEAREREFVYVNLQGYMP